MLEEIHLTLHPKSMAKDVPGTEEGKHPYAIGTHIAGEEDDDLLPDKDAAKGFYAKYEPKEILGR